MVICCAQDNGVVRPDGHVCLRGRPNDIWNDQVRTVSRLEIPALMYSVAVSPAGMDSVALSRVLGSLEWVRTR